ncbi:MAG: imidazole glycerol phosphate synthase subunit HisH [Bernardetiaceae bacterium]
MRVAIFSYNAGNTRSVAFAFERLGAEVVVSAAPEVLMGADRVVFPGVGHARSAMDYLQQHGLDRLLGQLRQPVLGICLGLQLMCRHSEEGNTSALGIFPVAVKRFSPEAVEKVPHMGWNNIQSTQGKLFAGIGAQDFFYFVHSYYADPDPRYTIAEATYGHRFGAALQKDNFWAVQFHPEKSAAAGERLLQNFLAIA